MLQKGLRVLPIFGAFALKWCHDGAQGLAQGLQSKGKERVDMIRLDEMHDITPDGGQGPIRAHYRSYHAWLSRQSHQLMADRQQEAEMVFRRVGITFAVYGDKDADGAGTERLIPFDLIPRIIPAQEWRELEMGLVQRVTALNRFIHDIYHEQDILRAGLIPSDMVLGNAQFRPQMQGLAVPGDVYSHISGIDIVRALMRPDKPGISCWKTTCGCPAGSATCWKTAR